MPLNEYDAFLQNNPAPEPAKANPYDGAVQEQAESDQTRLRGSMFVAGQTTPDRAAQVIKLSERTKIPASIVERNFDTLSKKFDLSDNEYDAIIKDNPTVAQWLTDPTNASVSRDDLSVLQRIDNTFKSAVRGWTRADSGGDLADLLFKEVEQGGLSPTDAAQRDKLKAQQQSLSQADQANGLPEYLAGTTAYSARQMGTSLYWGAYGAGAGGVTGVVAGAPTGLGAVATGTAGVIAGGLTAGAMYSYRMETGFAFDDLRSMKDINGNTIDPMIARQAARGVGMVNAVIESGSTALLATLVPGFSKLTAGLGGDASKAAVRQAVKQALAVPTRRAMLLGALGKMGSMASIEGLEEFVQALVGAGGREVAQGVSGQDFAPDSVVGDLADASRQALDATVGTFFTFAPVGGAHIYVQARQAARAQQSAAFFGALGGGIKDSKTFERLPERMQNFVEQATKDGPIETAYVDPSAFVTYWQNQGVDPRAAAEEIIGDVTQYDHALLSGEQIEIPMSRYATRIAPTDHNTYFANEMRLSPEAMNAREGAEFEAKMAEESKAALAAVPLDDQAAIKQQIKQQLIDAGTEASVAETQAEAFATTAAVMAARSGQTPEQVLAPYGLKISRPSLQQEAAAPGETAMEQARRDQTESPEFKAYFGDSPTTITGKPGDEPLELYHGTAGNIQSFEMERGGQNFGQKEPWAFLTNDRADASEYANNAAEGVGTANVLPLYVALKNPLIIDRDSDGAGVMSLIENKQGLRPEIREALESGQYDGVIARDLGTKHVATGAPLQVVIATRPEQIKSSIGNTGAFDANDPRIMHQKGRAPSLIIQHNLTAENLLHALRMGGLVAPSLAINKAADAMTNFGEITLIGKKEMADPRGYARPKVFGADVYSPRYPDVHYKFSAAGEKVLRDQIERFSSVTGERYFDLDELQKKGASYLRTIATMMAAFLTEKGIAFERVRGDDKYRSDMDTRMAMSRRIEQNNLDREFERFTEAFLVKMNPAERIFKGFNYNGNRTYAAHTIDNVIRMLKKDLRGGESSGNIYGVGQLRAKFTPQFRSVTAIKAAEGRIVSDAEFERVKDEIDAEFFAIVEAVTPYYKHTPELFRFNDTVLAVIEDGTRMGLDKAAAEYSFDPLPDDVKDQIRQFYAHLRNMPTEYFEAKILRGVSVSEFAGAAVPNDAPQEVIDALTDHGVAIERYQKAGTNDGGTMARKAAIDALTGKLGETVLFQNDTIDGLTGEVVPNPTFYSLLTRQIESAKIDKVPAAQWKAYINGLSSKGVTKAEIVFSGVMPWLDIEAARRAPGRESYRLISGDGEAVAEGDATAKERWEQAGRSIAINGVEIRDFLPDVDPLVRIKIRKALLANIDINGDVMRTAAHEALMETTKNANPAFAQQIADSWAKIWASQKVGQDRVATVIDGPPAEGQSIVKLPALDPRISRQDVLDYLAEFHTKVEEKILGEPRKPPAATPGTDVATQGQIPEGYSLREGDFGEFIVTTALGAVNRRETSAAAAAAWAWRQHATGDTMTARGDRADGLPDEYRIDLTGDNEFAVTLPDGTNLDIYETREEAIEAAQEHAAENEITDEQVEERAAEIWQEQLPEEAREYSRESEYVNQNFDVYFRPPNFRIERIPMGTDLFGTTGYDTWGVRKLEYDDLPPQMEDDDGTSARETKGMPDDIDEFNEMWPEGPTESWATHEQFTSEQEARDWAESQTDDNDFPWHDGDPLWTTRDPEDESTTEDFESWDDVDSARTNRVDQRFEWEVDSYIENASYSDTGTDYYEEEARRQLEDERGNGGGNRNRNRAIAPPPDPTAPKYPVRYPTSYQSTGGRDLREIVIMVPGIEKYNEGDTIHYGGEGGGRAVVWIRFQIIDDNAGVPTLVIEEDQSQRGQHGLEKGFKGEFDQKEYNKLAEKYDAVKIEYSDALASNTLPEGYEPIVDRSLSEGRQWGVIKADQSHAQPLWGGFATEADAREYGIKAIYEGRVALISEQMRQLQSDSGKVPLAPFVGSTQAWAGMGLMRAIRYAVDNGIKQVAWTTGAQNAVRYGLQSEMDLLKWEKVEGGYVDIKAFKDGKEIVNKKLTDLELGENIGNRVKNMIIADPQQMGSIDAKDLDSINGLGMMGFYGDKKGLNTKDQPAIMTVVANDALKLVGGNRVEPIDITLTERGKDVTFVGAPGLKITPQMEDKIRGGFPMRFKQNGGDVKRGRIRFGADRKFYIDLLEGANLSTFIHESGHFWLEVFGDLVDGFKQRDPATLDDRQKRMVADYDTLLKWLGAETRMDITEAQHEQFARGIEKYFMQGTAPSAELRTVFARVRTWMLSIYKSLGMLRVSISPEVKDVFDRMMATDEQIAAAEAEAEIVPLFEDEQEFIKAGFDQAFVDAYRSQVQKARDVAEQQLQTKLMATLTRERDAWFKAERVRVRNEISVEVITRREQIALSVMTRGTLPDGGVPEIEGKIRLNRAEVDAIGGENAWKRLPRGMTVANGVPLQIAAELFGYTSGDELVKAMNSVRPAGQVIDEATDAKMKELHGDLLVDGGIVEAARAAVQNEERSKVIEAELRALSHLRAMAAPGMAAQARQAADAAGHAERQQAYQARWQAAETALLVAIQKGESQAIIDKLKAGLSALKAGIRTTGAQIRASIPPIDSIRQAAKGRISATRVRDIKPMQFWNAARKASQDAKLAASSQDYQGAITAKQRELLNLELYRAAIAAQEEVEKTADYMRRFEDNKTRARIAKAGQDYLDQIDGFLDRYDFAHVSLKALDRRKNLETWVKQKEADGEPVNLPDGVLVEERINYKDMTVEELRGVSDSVKHIEHLAKLKNKLLKSRRTADLQAAIEELDESLRLNVRKAKGVPIETRLPKDEAVRFIDTWFAMHRKLSEFARQMDGWKDGGLAWEYFVRPVNEAGDAETTMNHVAAAKLKELFGFYKGAEIAAFYTKQDIPELGHALTRMGQIMVALNWGNLDSRQKLMDGRGWNEQQVEAILNRLDERDWQFVQDTFDFINSYWPLIEAKEKRVNGIAPEKVVAAPIVTRFGEIAGGYFPLSYDDRVSPRAFGNRVKELSDQMMKGAFTRASTRRGHTHERVAGVSMRVRLDFGVITEHIAQVIHDLTHHEMLIDINRMLGNKQIADTIIAMHGDVIYKQMQEAIRDVAAGYVPAINAFEKSLNHVRTGMTVAALGWNVFTSLLQPFGLSQSWVRVGGVWIAKGIGRWVGDAAHMENTATWIKAKSPAMNDRMNTQLREINEIRNDIGLNTGKLSGWIDEALRKTTFDTVHRQAIVDSFFWLIGKGQQIADIPTWLGAYEKAMADTANDEARAIAMADQAVLDSQGGGMIKDLAGIQRGGPLLKVWTAFYSYFNVTWNRNVEAVGRTHFKNPVEVARLGVDLLLLNTLPATLGWIAKEMLTGKDDDWDDWIMQLLQANLSYMMGMMVGLREFGSVVQGFYGYSGPAGIRFFSDMGNLLKQAGQGEMDAAAWKALNATAGTLLHYPAGQVKRTVEGFNAMMEGETKNPMALLVGPRKE